MNWLKLAHAALDSWDACIESCDLFKDDRPNYKRFLALCDRFNAINRYCLDRHFSLQNK